MGRIGEHGNSLRKGGMYRRHKFDLVGFGKAFEDRSHLDDLLNIPDFAAGVVQDLLEAHKTEEGNVPGGEEKIPSPSYVHTLQVPDFNRLISRDTGTFLDCL